MQDFCPRINMFKGNCKGQSCKKCRNCTFKVNFLCQKSKDFFKKNHLRICINLGEHFLRKSFFSKNQFLNHFMFCYFFRKIAKGEEITLNYIGLINNIHRDQRRKCLFESHQFDCFCTGCNLSEENLTVCWELIQWKVRGQWKKTKDLFQKNQTTTVVNLLLQYTVVVWCFMNKSLEQPMAMKSAVQWVDAQHCKKI